MVPPTSLGSLVEVYSDPMHCCLREASTAHRKYASADPSANKDFTIHKISTTSVEEDAAPLERLWQDDCRLAPYLCRELLDRPSKVLERLGRRDDACSARRHVEQAMSKGSLAVQIPGANAAVGPDRCVGGGDRAAAENRR